MRMTPQSIRRMDDALLIKGHQGYVLVRQRLNGLETIYQGDQLVNGSAQCYSSQLLEEAIEYVTEFPLPWRIEPDGTQRIKDHKRFYEQTFNSDLQGIETLKRWIQTPCPSSRTASL